MKNIRIIVFFILGTFLLNACELDNYEGPTASLSGAIIDIQTGEPIQSDIINGTRIELIEDGYDNPSSMRLAVKNDGSYRHDMLFENTYFMPPIMGGNFVPQSDTVRIDIKGNTTHNFEVLPYIRVKDAQITINGLKVTATFKLEQTVDTLNVLRIGLFGHREPQVGEPMQMARQLRLINRAVTPDEEFTLDLTLRARDFPLGQQYHFRVGAVIDAPEAKYNYAPAVRLLVE
jgi:hypothetical protein